MVQVASEKNSTLVLPFPVELLRFLEASTGRGPVAPTETAAPPAVDAATPAETAATPAAPAETETVSPADRDGPAAG